LALEGKRSERTRGGEPTKSSKVLWLRIYYYKIIWLQTYKYLLQCISVRKYNFALSKKTASAAAIYYIESEHDVFNLIRFVHFVF
jgi:hypothetical protein